jgi:hypothetical protein
VIVIGGGQVRSRGGRLREESEILYNRLQRAGAAFVFGLGEVKA